MLLPASTRNLSLEAGTETPVSRGVAFTCLSLHHVQPQAAITLKVTDLTPSAVDSAAALAQRFLAGVKINTFFGVSDNPQK
jgi:hypothetical protein